MNILLIPYRVLRALLSDNRPWAVDYDLAYDGGGSAWTKGYRTKAGAHTARLWNLYVASWGGTADLRKEQP